MTPEALTAHLDRLIAAGESEVVEFKDANDNFPTSDIGKYFSALANEANLTGADAGWLVFGVSNAPPADHRFLLPGEAGSVARPQEADLRWRRCVVPRNP